MATQEQRNQIIKRYKAGESTHAIGKSFGVKGPSIAWHLRKAKVPLRPIGRYKKSNNDEC